MVERKNNNSEAVTEPIHPGTVSKLEYFIERALTKLKNAWVNRSAANGIQFYIEADD